MHRALHFAQNHYKEVGLNEALQGNLFELGTADKHLPIDLVAWGDSHAMATPPVFDLLCKERSVRGLAAWHAATVPFVGYESSSLKSANTDSLSLNNAIVEFILREQVKNVILIFRMSWYVEADNGTDRLRNGLIATIKALDGSGARIWIMRQVPKPPLECPPTRGEWHLLKAWIPNASQFH